VIFDIILEPLPRLSFLPAAASIGTRLHICVPGFSILSPSFRRLALVNHGLVLENVWVWIILIARFARVVDRLLGDGFLRRKCLALVEGFEEEIPIQSPAHYFTR